MQVKERACANLEQSVKWGQKSWSKELWTLEGEKKISCVSIEDDEHEWKMLGKIDCETIDESKEQKQEVSFF